jgi:hypothetical protein
MGEGRDGGRKAGLASLIRKKVVAKEKVLVRLASMGNF